MFVYFYPMYWDTVFSKLADNTENLFKNEGGLITDSKQYPLSQDT